MDENTVKNKKMTNCKTCGTEIAKSAKVCPNCGAKQKKKHPFLAIFSVLIVLIVIIASTAGGDDTQTDSKTSFTVGEIASMNDINVTLVSVTENKGSEFNKPTDGNIYVLCEFEIENNSNREINVSSALSFEGYCDGYACTFSLGALIEKGNKNQLDGSVAAGKKFNGVIGYEVPANWKELEVKFTPDFWTGRDMTFVANNE